MKCKLKYLFVHLLPPPACLSFGNTGDVVKLIIKLFPIRALIRWIPLYFHGVMVNLPLQIKPSESANCDCLHGLLMVRYFSLTFRNSVYSHGRRAVWDKIRTDLLLCTKNNSTCSLIKQPHKFYYDYGVVHNDLIKRHLHRTELTRAFGIEGIQMSCGKIKSK